MSKPYTIDIPPAQRSAGQFKRTWNEYRRLFPVDPLVVEAATVEVDGDRWRKRLDEWQGRLAAERLARAVTRLWK